MIATMNPATGELLEEYPEMTESQIERCVHRAYTGFLEWREISIDDRAKLVMRLADELELHREPMARLASLEMGKPITEARIELDKCVWLCRQHASLAPDYFVEEAAFGRGGGGAVIHEPLGPILAVAPWNFPYSQVLRHALPALMVGNVVLFKPSPKVLGCAGMLTHAVHRAGVPTGVFQRLIVKHRRTDRLIGDPRIQGVVLTGRQDAGRAIATSAAQHVKKTVLELGGSDAFIVCDDADIAAAAALGSASRLRNAGQSRISAKRFVVHERVAEEFVERLVGQMSAGTLGDPLDEVTTLGPLAAHKTRARIHWQVEQSVADGARVALGGAVIDGAGFFYPPTVLTDVRGDHLAAREDLFGPVAAIMTFTTDADAVAIANTRSGIGASIWTTDTSRARWLWSRISAGNVAVNDMVRSDPEMVRGGTMRPGYGRELGRVGALEFTNEKIVRLWNPENPIIQASVDQSLAAP